MEKVKSNELPVWYVLPTKYNQNRDAGRWGGCEAGVVCDAGAVDSEWTKEMVGGRGGRGVVGGGIVDGMVQIA